MTTTDAIEREVDDVRAALQDLAHNVEVDHIPTLVRASTLIVQLRSELERARWVNELARRLDEVLPNPWWSPHLDPLLAYLDAAGQEEHARAVREILTLLFELPPHQGDPIHA